MKKIIIMTAVAGSFLLGSTQAAHASSNTVLSLTAHAPTQTDYHRYCQYKALQRTAADAVKHAAQQVGYPIEGLEKINWQILSQQAADQAKKLGYSLWAFNPNSTLSQYSTLYTIIPDTLAAVLSANLHQRLATIRASQHITTLTNQIRNPNPEDQTEENPLMQAVVDANHIRTRLLLLAGADPNEQDEEGDTPLTLAATLSPSGSLNTIVAELLHHGANMNYKNDTRGAKTFAKTPLMLAAEDSNLQMVQQLLEAGANPFLTSEAGNNTALSLAQQNGSTEIAALLEIAMKNADSSIEPPPKRRRTS